MQGMKRWLTCGTIVAALVAGWHTAPSALTSAQASQAAAPARETLAELPGARLWYHDTGGSGVPVVFLHAATGSSRVWEYQIPAFTARGYRVIAYDRRGFGRSAIDPASSQPGTGADDLQSLMQHLGVDRFHLVGTAAGAFVALDFALSFPQRLRSLVVANSIGGVQDEDYVAMGRRIRPSPQFDALPPEFRELGPSYRAGNPGGTERWKELERTSRPDGPPPAQTLRNRITFTLLEGISVPTLLLTGDADLYAPPPILRLFAARIKSSQSVVVPEAGHSAYWEQPEIFNRSVLEFIGQH
jgi:pimeloyl-ACP methyl ester carboxylesterase